MTDEPSAANEWLVRLLRKAGDQAALRGLFTIVIGLFGRERKLLGAALVTAIVLTLLALLPPVLLSQLIDHAFSASDVRLVGAIGGALVAIAICDGAFSLARRLLSAFAIQRFRSLMLAPALAAVLRLPIDHLLSRDQGLLGRTFEETERLAEGASEDVIEFVLAVGMIFILSGAMLFVSPYVGMAVLGAVILLALLHSTAAGHLRAREMRWFETRSQYWAHLVEAIAYVNTIRYNSAHEFAEARFRERLDRDIAAHLAVTRLSGVLDVSGRLAGGLIIAIIATIGGMQVVQGSMSVGHFVLFVSIGGSLSVPVLALVKIIDDVQALRIAADRLLNLMMAPREQVDRVSARSSAESPVLELEQVHYAYAGSERHVLSGLNLIFKPGERVAITGASGIGKSTLASILFAARQPQSGSVMLGGQDSSAIPLGDWRRHIVLVPHDVEIFTGTIATNITLGLADVDEAALTKVIAASGLADDIAAMPDGMATLLGQGGVDLSAGQKQRLGIARALLRQPDILVLDESTSSLDLATEARVLDALIRNYPDMTIIAITHRASVVEKMDRQVHLEALQTVETGQIPLTIAAAK